MKGHEINKNNFFGNNQENKKSSKISDDQQNLFEYYFLENDEQNSTDFIVGSYEERFIHSTFWSIEDFIDTCNEDSKIVALQNDVTTIQQPSL